MGTSMDQTQQISMQDSSFSRDLLQRFNPNATPKNELLKQEVKISEEIELTLGLSTNGRFGIDPSSKRLKLSSSTPNFKNPVKKHEEDDSEAMTWQSTEFSRTYSVPVEIEGEWRRRKALRRVKRLEAKRRRIEKQRSFRVAKEWDMDRLGEKCEQDCKFDHQCIKVLMPPRGVKKCVEPRSSTNTPTLTELSANEAAAENRATTEKLENPSKTVADDDMESDKIVRNVMLRMHCVSTIGHGPNGKRVQGLLCPCKEGEEVKIVCVCHGSFLSASEFVKHGGGGEVVNPLKHIVVNPPPTVL